jgi:hypothetical protein
MRLSWRRSHDVVMDFIAVVIAIATFALLIATIELLDRV